MHKIANISTFVNGLLNAPGGHVTSTGWDNAGASAFTDGLAEARSPSGEVYGNERLPDVMRAHASGSSSELVTGVIDALKAFTRQAEPHDDLTLLAAKRD